MISFALFLIPLTLLIAIVVSLVVCIYLLAKAHGNVKNLERRQKRTLLFFALLPVVLAALSITTMITNNNQSKQELKEDIASGVVKIYEVSTVTNPTDTTTKTFPLSENIPQLSFDIFSERLYTEVERGDIKIRTNEFADVAQITNNDIGFIRLNPGFLDVNEKIAILKSKNTEYTKQNVAIGTIIEEEEKKSSGSGRFMFQLFFNDIDNILLISVSYTDENDSRVRYTPVISRTYARQLYDLITASINLKIATPVIAQ